jgi:putative ABC transport system permease protein
MKLTGIGVVLGLGAAYGVTRFLKALLYGVKAADPATFVVVAVVVTAVAAVACLVPARRAAAVAPVKAIRHT